MPKRLLPRLVLGTALTALLATAPFMQGGAEAAGGRYLAELILTDLPDPASAPYLKLKSLAGAARMQTLEMTGAELWRVPTARLVVIMHAARAAGVGVRRIDKRVASPMLGAMAGGASMSPEQTSMMRMAQSGTSVMAATMLAAPPPAVAEYVLSRGMAPEDSDRGARIALPINGRETVTLQRQRLDKAPDGYVWAGVVEETGQPVTLRWWTSGRLAGVVHHEGRAYVIRHLGGGMHASIEVVPGRLPQEHAPAPAGMIERMHMTEDPLVMRGDASLLRETRPHAERPPSHATRAEETVITLAVAYTRAAAAHYTDIGKDVVALAIAEANQAFRNSGIDGVRLELAHAYQTDYQESGTHFDHVWRFADKGDGVMEEIHAVRDRHAADVAVLVVHDPRGCGLSTRVAADADEAFAVVHHECAVTTYSLAHEIGHIIGARHDRSLDSSDSPFPHGHGHVTPHWRTMMAYQAACDGCPRVPFWSNPEVTIAGEPTGTESANNAKVIREHAARVAAFRGGPQHVADEQIARSGGR